MIITSSSEHVAAVGDRLVAVLELLLVVGGVPGDELAGGRGEEQAPEEQRQPVVAEKRAPQRWSTPIAM